MRVSTPWFVAGIILIFMMLTYNKSIQKRSDLIDVNNINNPESLQGAFNENRKSVVSAQEFLPRFTQDTSLDFNYKSAMRQLIDKQVTADDPRLVQIIRNYYIEQPSTEPYNLDFPNRLEFSNGQTPFIDSRLNYIESGFYVECGGLNGEKGSNSLFFEKVRKWNGLVIEADPSNYQILKTKHRKSFTANACLSPRPVPAKLTFNKAFNIGRIVHDQSAKDWIKKQRIAPDPVEVSSVFIYASITQDNN